MKVRISLQKSCLTLLFVLVGIAVNAQNPYKLAAGARQAGMAYASVATDGFWSSFQTIGLNNKVWMSRLQTVAKVYAILVAVGFAIIPIYFLIKF